MENNKNKPKYAPIELNYSDKDNNKKSFYVNGSLWNRLEQSSKRMNYDTLYRNFLKLLEDYQKFKVKELDDPFSNYFKSCQFFKVLESIGLIEGKFTYFGNSTGIIKIGPSKNLKKNSTIVDDSTVLDKDTQIIRDSIGNEEELHRGYLLYNSLSTLQQQDIVFNYHFTLKKLLNIFLKIKKNEIDLFDPIDILQKIVKHCILNKYESAINYLCMEVHDTPYLLTQEERNNLFNDYESLNKLWESGFITDNHGKFRIYIMSIYFLNFI